MCHATPLGDPQPTLQPLIFLQPFYPQSPLSTFGLCRWLSASAFLDDRVPAGIWLARTAPKPVRFPTLPSFVPPSYARYTSLLKWTCFSLISLDPPLLFKLIGPVAGPAIFSYFVAASSPPATHPPLPFRHVPTFPPPRKTDYPYKPDIFSLELLRPPFFVYMPSFC